MVKRRIPSGDGKDYAVGYGKPPVHSRFRPGQSGYPSGRRKGSRNLKTDVKRTLNMPLKVKEAGRTRKRSTQEAALMVLREKALQGDGRSLDRLLELALRFNNEAADAGPAQALSADDQSILAAYVAERIGTGRPPTPPALSERAASIPRRRSKRRRTK